jgi:hypothetical protein
MPSGLISINAFICEKILVEQDQVMSAIRMVEVFSVSINPDLPLDKQGTLMMVYIAGRVPAEDNSEHQLDIVLVRPNGETKPIGDPIRSVFPPSGQPGFQKGFNIGLQLGVAPTQMGVHHFSIKFDGEEVRRIPFILQQGPLPLAAPKP